MESGGPVLVADRRPLSGGPQGFLSHRAGVFPQSRFCIGLRRTGEFTKFTKSTN